MVFGKIMRQCKIRVCIEEYSCKSIIKMLNFPRLFAIIECNVTNFINFQKTSCIKAGNEVK